ncbi:MAG: SIR2 family protein [Dehalococcoidia bacterium]|nr:SIR2 family protein [Dehalococcoidia bacterium]
MIGLILGAGFSKWAAGLPLASELFDFAITAHNQRDARRLQRVVRLKAQWDEANPYGLSEQFVADALRSSDRNRRLVSWYVTRRLLDPFIGTVVGGTQSLMIDDSRRLQHEGIRIAQQFLRQFEESRLSGIVTTNYDLLVEYALGTGGFNYGALDEELKGRGKNPWFPWQGIPVKLTGSRRLAKIHGSVSWDGNSCYTDGRCGVKGTALIVPPGSEKETPERLRSTWGLARSILADSTDLLVFGFAFNPYDEAALTLLATAGRQVRSVFLIDPDPKIGLAQQVWPGACTQAFEPPPQDNAGFGAWVRDSGLF